MQPDPRFIQQKKDFWAHIRTISQEVGYTDRQSKKISVPTLAQIREAFNGLGLSTSHIMDDANKLSPFGKTLMDYFQYRADVLNNQAQANLMNAEEAKTLFQQIRGERDYTCPLPLNKQTGDKKAEAYLTCIVNMIVEANAEGMDCDYNPLSLTTVTDTEKLQPLRTLARRVDGAFPSAVNPIAVWEIKEYYYTTTFGSRVADGVYETLLDGLEIEELRVEIQKDIKHYLMVDAKFTWWDKGKSYLCRIINMLHMGYVDEALIGREVVERLPALVKEWVVIAKRQSKPSS